VREPTDIDWSNPVAVFPLPSVSLLPHALQPLHVFEQRYRRMVRDALGDAESAPLSESAPVAMAAFEGDDWRTDYAGTPPLRPMVCVGRIVRHVPLPDGRHDIVLHGVARAQIMRMVEPTGGRPYRMAMLEPVPDVRRAESRVRRACGVVGSILERPRMSRWSAVAPVRALFDGSVPSCAALGMASHAMIRDPDRRYALLSEPEPCRRACLVREALLELERLVALAERQGSDGWPKGQSWN
jgi:Lon protease-like protein